jgi:hypothetical protein
MANLEKPIKLTAEIQWAFLNKKSELSDRYQVDLTNLSDRAVAALEEVGIKPMQRDDKPEKGWYITVKSSNEIRAFDLEGNQITDLVANGSKAIAYVKPYEWKFQSRKGISPSLTRLTITDLKVYNGGESQELEEDDIPL